PRAPAARVRPPPGAGPPRPPPGAPPGQVFVNTYGAAGGVELPFGGWKRSGYGREKGVEGLLGYTQTKTVVVGIS
ncbi:aldehyde dehydrogenase family protein, partial [Pseudonocardia sp.]|uniref:aldehyde dehydrogenase family protein n=1 Tax=Pseudonocardia sp. TaxID=60912 RepID=UPI00262C8ACF